MRPRFDQQLEELNLELIKTQGSRSSHGGEYKCQYQRCGYN